MTITDRYRKVRNHSTSLCKDLITEDYSLQASEEVSPPKWHLAHTTWFFEQFILVPYDLDYKVAHPQFNFLFNSYYNAHGARTARNQRGLMTRPSVEEVKAYREYVDAAMIKLLDKPSPDVSDLVILGCNHEQQHQELLLTDLKYNFWFNPLDISVIDIKEYKNTLKGNWLKIDSGIYEIGHEGKGFCFDNELGRHKVYLQDFKIFSSLVTNEEYSEFMDAGGYQNSNYWHDEGWAWVNANQIKAPLYWEKQDEKWTYYTLAGRQNLKPNAPVSHVNFYEASAYAAWRGVRLPTEFEWEIASGQFEWGERWEWTNSAYLPYPGFATAPGALGEYNGKFMVNQMVLRGGSVATSEGHSRSTYRNFFHPHYRWQFMGIRLAKTL